MANTTDREREIFSEALALENGERRAAYLREACGADEPLRRRILELLEAHEDARGFIPTREIDAESTLLMESPISEGPGTKIGRYKLLQKIGEGGMGVVYMAEQEEPVRRRVALKIIKLGMDTRQVVARFEAERQALALMDHPNIAKVLDGGATETGRPYFVMELIQGVPITEYCAKAKLPTRQRLKLFISVCQAIQSAHQKGVIHRDLKPSNVLVTMHNGEAMPKVIDFGIAKATNQKLTEKTLFTNFASMIGTPAYMSPEQAELSSMDVDTRADIYALGVLLYELLTGTTPFPEKRLRSLGYGEMQRVIVEEEPERPSTRLSTLANEQKTVLAKTCGEELGALGNLLKGDLDWIVMKCLEKDRQRRYETANGLAADLHRHLSNEPVLARPPSLAYRWQKSWRRNRMAYAAGFAVVLALLTGLAAATLSYTRERQSREIAVAAESAAKKARLEESAQRRNAEMQAVRAQEGESRSRRLAYASAMNLAQQALAMNNIGRAEQMLAQQRPEAGKADLRGWEWRYLWQQTQGDELFQLGRTHTTPRSISISADGNFLVTGAMHQGAWSLWDLRLRRQMQAPAAGNGQVIAAFSPTDTLVAHSLEIITPTETNAKRYLCVWDMATQKERWRVELNGMCAGLVFSGDGEIIATSTHEPEGILTVWRVRDGLKLASHVVGQANSIQGMLLAASSDFSTVVHATRAGGIRAVEPISGKARWQVVEQEDLEIQAIAISSDGRLVASNSGFSGPDIIIRDGATGLEIGRAQGHRTYMLALVFENDGKTLYSASADQTICSWDLGDPTRPKLQSVYKGHSSEVWGIALARSKSTLYSISKDWTIRAWEANRESKRKSVPIPANALCAWNISPDGSKICTLETNGVVSWLSGTGFRSSEPIIRLSDKVVSGVISPDGKWLAAGWETGEFEVWSLTSRNRAVSGRVTDNKAAVPWVILPNKQHLLVYTAHSGVCEEWDFSTGKLIRKWDGLDPIAFPNDHSRNCTSPDESLWFQGFYGKDRITIRDMSTDAVREQTSLDSGAIHAIGISADGKLLGIASNRGFVSLWDAKTLQPRGKFRGFLQSAASVCFSPDGTRLAAGGDGKEAVKLWDIESQKELLTLEGKGSWFERIRFSSDGNVIAASNGSGLLHVWRAPSWQEIEEAEKIKE